MPTAANQSYSSNGFDDYASSRFDLSNTISPDKVSYNYRDICKKFGLDTPRSTTLGSASRSPLASSILNLTGNENLSTCPENSILDTSVLNFTDHKGLGLERSSLSPQAEEMRTSKLMLDLSNVKNSMSNRNNGSPPFSDSSVSTGSSSMEMGFFPHSVQTCRSDTPNSETSIHSAESLTNHSNLTFPQLTEQGFANLQNLHVISCMSNMSKDQVLQTVNVINMLQSMLQIPQSTSMIENDPLEMQARYHRSAAVSGNVEAQCTWSGTLAKRSYKGGPYSSKVFLGGVPWDISEQTLICSFHQFGNVKVEWPGKEAISQPKGYAYIIFENEMQVKLLLDSCREGVDEHEGCFYYKVPTNRRSRPKEVQVIPWAINDSNYSVKTFQKLDPCTTVFVGALHGMMNAEGLFRVMNDLFGGVIYAGIDTDKNKYPIGSGRVTFDNYKSYVKAVKAAFVDVKSDKFTKKVQIDPYLEDTPCSLCNIALGPYFCRENGCFRYFCTGCWNLHHTQLKSHKPLMRNSKHGTSPNVMISSH